MSDKDKFVNVADLKRKLRYWGKSRGASKQSIESLMETIGRIPYSVKAELETTLEAEPVKRGKWIDVDYKTLEHGFLETYPDEGVCCSECRTGFKKSRQLIRNFCPNCGARMDGADKLRELIKESGCGYDKP